MQRDLVILSSSPAPPCASQNAPSNARNGARTISTVQITSSPPDLPPPSGSFVSNSLPSGLRTGSHAKVVPERAVFGFQSALALPLEPLEAEGEKTKRKSAAKTKPATSKASKSTKKVEALGTLKDQTDAYYFKDIDAEEVVPKKRGRPKKADGLPTKPRKPRAKKATKEVSGFFEEKENLIQGNETIDLTATEALKRKRGWTPPISTEQVSEASASVSASIVSDLSRFAHVDITPKISPKKAESTLMKRKQLEMIEGAKVFQVAKDVSLPNNTNESPRKQSPTKKLKTITALALERYDTAPKDTDEITELLPEPEFKAPAKKTSKGKSKATITKTAKKPTAPKLLSPLSAVQRLERQNVQFGTSSQLAGAESPTYLRNLQRALDESAASAPVVSEMLKKFRGASRASQGSMWSAGAVHSDEAVLEMSKDDGFRDIDAGDVSIQRNPHDSIVQINKELEFRDIDEIDVHLPAIAVNEDVFGDEIGARLPSTNEEANDQTVLEAEPKPSPERKPRGRPRKGSTASATAISTKVKESSKVRTLSKAKVARPRTLKKATTDLGFIDIDEIQDSEPELTPSPPRLVRAATSPLPLTKKAPEKRTSKATRATKNGTRADWDVVKEILYPQITDVVMNNPRSEDFEHPTWYEKMLIFEPVVLEDFTEWLNEKGICIKAECGKTDPIVPWMTQKWCEDQSICCLKKTNNRNLARPAA